MGHFGPQSLDVGRGDWSASPRTDGLTIASQPRRTPPRTQSSAPTRRSPAIARKPPPLRTLPARGRSSKAQPYRPNYWLVGAVAVIVGVLGFAFLVSIMILWTMAGPLTTAAMVLAYAAAMCGLWRVGLSRL